MKIELGKWYRTRDGEHLVRIISLIGKWSKRHPVVGEFHELKGKKKIQSEGMFLKYEHWTKNGNYLTDEVDASFDLISEEP